MRNLILILVLLLSACNVRKVSNKEYITIRDTVITPPIVKLDTLTQFNDRFIYLKDTTGQLTVTIEKVRDNYIRVKGKCEPEKIIVPVTKTVTKTKEVTVKNLFWKNVSLFLFLLLLILLVHRFLYSIQRI